MHKGSRKHNRGKLQGRCSELRYCIAHFKTRFLNRSETFIRLQMESMPDFDHLAVCREFLKNPLTHGIDHYTPPAIDFFLSKLIRRMPMTSIELKNRGIILVHAHFGKDGWIASSIAGSNRRPPLVVSFYGRDASAVMRIPTWRRRFAHLFRVADRILVLSSHMKGLLESDGCPSAKLLVHSFGVDIAAFPFIRRNLPVYGRTRLLFVGRLVRKKGLETALRAIALLPGCELEVIGDGPGHETGCKLAGELGIIDRVRFSGWKIPAEVGRIMAASHALLVPSETGPDGDMEGTPTVIFEAMASGLPVIGTGHAGIPEQLGSGECGMIVPEGDWQALAEAVESLCSSEASCFAMAIAARSRVEECYDSSKQGAKLEEIYRSLLPARVWSSTGTPESSG